MFFFVFVDFVVFANIGFLVSAFCLLLTAGIFSPSLRDRTECYFYEFSVDWGLLVA